MFIAGQTGNDPSKPQEPVVDGGVGPQTTQALRNIAAILHEVGADCISLVSLTVYIKDSGTKESRQKDWEEYNEAYKRFFKARGIETNLPARAQVWVADVPWATENTLVEIVAIAYVNI